MIVRPRLADLRVIGLYSGKVLVGVGLLMGVPLLVSLLYGEWNPVVDFLLGMGACFAVGFLLSVLCQTTRDLTWGHGLVVASSSWLLAMAVGALPHWFSGHFGSYLDAMFDMMSGFTTTGLYLIQDLDHVSNGLNMWRHLLTYLGGQGLVVLALAFLFRGTAGAYKTYVGEGKDERLLPNVVQTARAIWLVSLSFMAVGTASLWLLSLSLGQDHLRALFHSLWIFMGAWSTGGFAPMSYNTFYYHSLPFELVCLVIMVLGSFNFALHWAVWSGDRRDLRRNIEVVSFFLTVAFAVVLVTVGLLQAGVYPEAMALCRKLIYQVLSGHTTTGFQTIYARVFVVQWGALAMVGITLAMAIGGSACSTAGGFKGLRMGIVFKALIQDVRRIISPESAHVVQHWHHLRTRVLDDGLVRASLIVILSYVGIYTTGAVLGVYSGYEPLSAFFESVSAGSNSGLSCGITAPAMPSAMKWYDIFAMAAGRLEFMSLFALGGYVVSLVRGK